MINVEEVCKHIQSYIEIYEFVQQDEKPISEVKAYLMEVCCKPESTARSHIEAVKKSDTGLLQVYGDKIGLDLGKAKEFSRALNDIFHWEKYDDRSIELHDYKKALEKANKTIVEANKTITEMDEIGIQELSDHLDEIREFREKQRIDRLQNQAMERNFLKAKTEQGVVDSASIEIKAGWTSSGRKLFTMKEIYPSLDLDTCALSSYFEKMKRDSKLTAVKLRTVRLGRIFSDKILGKVVEHIAPLRKLRNCIWPNRDVLTTEELLSYDGLTNSEKLSLYAFFSKRYSKDEKQILDQAAENGINAEFVIRILETYVVSKRTKDAFLEALELAQSDSEYLLRMKFAEELVRKQWWIEAKYNGKMTKFQLVPVDVLEEMKSDLRELERSVEYEMDEAYGPVDQNMEDL